MKKLIVHNVGPVAHVELELKRINVIIGPQSAGKSCILKLACFCAWLEKQNELLQGKYITDEDGFWQESLVEFHKINGYVKKGDGAYFSYSSSSMTFSYDFDTNKFDFKWKQAGRWKYRRSRISYIPAERNIVGAVPNWLDVDLPENYIRSFIVDWSKARQNYDSSRQLPILGLGIGYYYDESRGKDMVAISGDNSLQFSESSSGLQSLIPILFPKTQVDMIYDIIGKSSIHKDSVFIATHSPYILYAINNCMMGYLAKDNIPKGEMCKNEKSWIDPNEVAVWELRNGMLSPSEDSKNNTLQDEDGLVRGNYFDRIIHNVMADFTNYAMFYE